MAHPVHRFRWSNRVLTTTAAAAAVIIFTLSQTYYKSNNPSFNTDKASSSALQDWVSFTPVSDSHRKDALCLDGSAPGYHLRKGFGSGSRNWLLHVEGGGWCNTVASCATRKQTVLGSSKYMDQPIMFSGILSGDPVQNPVIARQFHFWASISSRPFLGVACVFQISSTGIKSRSDTVMEHLFLGILKVSLKEVEEENRESLECVVCPYLPQNGTELFFRGQLIWDAVMDDLLSMGLSSAKQALLSGCSAGGLATFLHCDDFQSVLPRDARVKCLIDAGFFLHEKDIAGNETIERFYHDVVNLQGVAKSLNKDCLSRTDANKCFFPEEFVAHIKTPLFLVNPAYDFWQIHNILAPDASDPQHSWHRCKLNIFNCSPSQLQVLHGFRDSFLRAVTEFEKKEEWGMFIDSCFSHCQTWMAETWHSPTSPRINNKTIAEAVGDWYFSRGAAKYIDCPFPCNPTCHNFDFSRG